MKNDFLQRRALGPLKEQIQDTQSVKSAKMSNVQSDKKDKRAFMKIRNDLEFCIQKS